MLKENTYRSQRKKVLKLDEKQNLKLKKLFSHEKKLGLGSEGKGGTNFG